MSAIELAATRTYARARASSTIGIATLSLWERLSCWAVSFSLMLFVATEWMGQRWILGLLQLSAFVAAAVALMYLLRSSNCGSRHLCLLAVLLPAQGVLQLALKRSAYPGATVLSLLHWAAFAAFFCVGQAVLSSRSRRIYLFETLMAVSALATGLELYQLFAVGRYGVLTTMLPLLSTNAYVELAELLLPVALYLVSQRRAHQWQATVLSAAMLATVILSGERTGSILVIAELIVGSAMLLKKRLVNPSQFLIPLLISAGAAFALVAAEGSTPILARFSERQPLEHRQDVVRSAIQMIRDRPMDGFGLGCFPVVYPQFQRFDSKYYINHVHNDYIEVMSEGGIVLLLVWATFIGLSLGRGLDGVWGLGAVAILVHSLTDFPIYRPPVAALFALVLAGVTVASSKTRKVSACAVGTSNTTPANEMLTAPQWNAMIGDHSK